MKRPTFLVSVFSLVLVLVSGHGLNQKEGIGIYELRKGNVCLKLTNWGATLVSFVRPDKNGNVTLVSFVRPDKNGKLIDIVLGYDSVRQYQNDTTYFGSIVGRVANRIGGAQFKLDGHLYKLVPNEGKNMLHGGPKGFSDVIWKVSKYTNKSPTPHIVFTYNSSDGEEGFPSSLQVRVTYKLLDCNRLSIVMKAKNIGDKATPVSLAQHAYWNLGGHNSGDILSNSIQIFGSKYTPVDSQLIPTGKIVPVKGTPYDFLSPAVIGSKINKLAKGYDINYALDDVEDHGIRKAAVLCDHKSGVTMELSTNAPGLQFYTGNMIKDVKGKGGYVYKAHAGLCLETQWYPDYVNHPKFLQSVVEPGKTYKHFMLFKLSTTK